MARGQHEVAYMCRCVVVPVSSHRDLCAQGGHSAHLCGLYGKALRLLESSLVHSSSRSPLLFGSDARRHPRARPRAVPSISKQTARTATPDRCTVIAHRASASPIAHRCIAERQGAAPPPVKYGVRVTVNRQTSELPSAARSRRSPCGFAIRENVRASGPAIGSGSPRIDFFTPHSRLGDLVT